MRHNLIITDPIHQVMNFGSDEKTRTIVQSIVDSQSFQRLRRTTQLGMSSYVFPGASHSRFAHSLGVAFLARKVLSHLIEHEEGHRKEIKDNRRNVIMAALLHDIGHGPFSHSFENVLTSLYEDVDVPMHEDWTSAIIRFDHSEINQILKRPEGGVQIEKIDSIFSERKEEDSLPLYLQEIISSQLDVDRMDYLVRDAHFAGVEIGRIDTQYLISCLTVIPDSVDGECHLGLVPKGVKAYESFAFARHLMMRSVYHHKAVNVLQWMVEMLLKQLILDLPKLPKDHLIYQMTPKYLKALLNYESYGDKEEFMRKHLDDYLRMNESQVWALIDALALETESSLITPEVIMLARKILARNLLKSFRIPEVHYEAVLEKVKNYPEGSTLIHDAASTMYKRSSKKVYVSSSRGVDEVTEFSSIINAFKDFSNAEKLVIVLDSKIEKDLGDWLKSL